jgi:hypothetical protein
VNGEWSILGGGKGIWGVQDEFRYTAEAMPGDGMISAKITSQQNTDPWAKSGIMLRAGTDPGAPYYAIFATPGNGTVVQYRTGAGDPATQVTGVSGGAPIYVEVIRTGDSYTSCTSTDGADWTVYPGSTVTIPNLTGSIFGGMADSSRSQFVTNTTVFDNFTFTTGISG